MIGKDPVLIVQHLLQNNWDPSSTSLNEQPDIHTGWFDYDAATPQVTVTNPNEFTVAGGNTGISASNGAGGVTQIRSGSVNVNGWAGTREELDNINPKKLAFELAQEIERIVGENPANHEHINSLAVESNQRITDTEAPERVFRHELIVRYTYVGKS